MIYHNSLRPNNKVARRLYEYNEELFTFIKKKLNDANTCINWVYSDYETS